MTSCPGHDKLILPTISTPPTPINKNANVYIRSIHVLQQTMASGSGTIIISQNKHSIILTAGHVCYPQWDGNLQQSILWVGDITTFNGRNIFYELIGLDKNNDLCLVKVNQNLKTNIPIANSMPFVGDKVYTSGYPLGIYSIGVLHIFDGYYSGYIQRDHIFSLPSVGGLSGAGIYNQNGEIIGVVSRTIVEFNSLTLASSSAAINRIIEVCIQKNGTENYIFCPITTQQSFND